MKVPPKRKGNSEENVSSDPKPVRLNESPSEKEGKFAQPQRTGAMRYASMKVPPKRKGNAAGEGGQADVTMPQ